jgi:leader peptidase (prepilin peptidase)/N-methyltransferase
MLPPLAFELPAFLLGLLFGSFLNVCISRLPLHKSISKPRSHCPRCLALIHWYDNIPLLSFVILRARCRNCKTAIPWRYPLVELAVGFWFARIASDIALQWNVNRPEMLALLNAVGTTPYPVLHRTPEFISIAILGFLLIGLLVMDWQTHTLPDTFTLTGTAIGFVLICVQAVFLAPGEGDIKLNPQHSLRMSSPGSFAAKGNVFMTGPEALVLGRLAAILAAAGLILLIRWLYKLLRHRDGLGLGDAKLMAMIAAFLGWQASMLALFLGVILCAGYALTLLARRRATAATRLPLGSFLCLGGLFAALFGEPLLTWYRSLL